MKMRIVDSTDGQFIGFIFDAGQKNIELPGGVSFEVSREIPLQNGARFANSNYVIDAEVYSGEDN